MSVQSFEEVIGEIDKEIKKYDSKSVVSPSFGDSTRKENYVGHPRINEANVSYTLTYVGHPRINEANVSYTSTYAAHLSLSARVPLAEIPSSLVNHGYAEGTWKRITRVGVAFNAGMSEAVGGKRSIGSETNQTELPKKRRVSQGDATKNKILAEASNQPYQKQ